MPDNGNRDEFPESTKRTLAARAGHRCSNPDCRAQTAGPQVEDGKALNVGVAAHISAAAPGGPRHDPNLSTHERAALSNGIWLCQNCAKLVDNDPFRFSRELLKNWRRAAEDEALNEIGKTRTRVDQEPRNWLAEHQAHAQAALEKRIIRGRLEAYFQLDRSGSKYSQTGGPSDQFSQGDLRSAARRAMFEKAGYWPLAPIIQRVCTPQARATEIVAEIDEAVAIRLGLGAPYSYWALRNTGEFYTTETYDEDLGTTPNPPHLFADYRIVRVTEALLYANRLYNALGVSGDAHVKFQITHSGLTGRLLGNASRRPFIPPLSTTAESEVKAEAESPIREINPQLPSLLRALTANLFGLFNFFTLTLEEYRNEAKWAQQVLGTG